MKKQTLNVYNKIKIREDVGYTIIDLKQFNTQEEIIRKRIIMHAITTTVGTSQNIEKVNIEDIIKLCANNIGNKYLTPNKNIKISVGKGQVILKKL